MSELKGACVIGQSGGPTSVINYSVLGALEAALDNPSITRVFGMAHGIKGLLNDDLYDICLLYTSFLFRFSYVILYLTTTYAIPQANKRKCHKKVILCSRLTCHSECTVVYYKCIVMIDRKVFSWNISPTHPRRPKHSAQNTPEASRQAMSLRSPATSVPARPHSRAACCTCLLYTSRCV